MTFSRKGMKDGRFRLRWSKYYKYIVDDETFYFKQKAYTNYCDGYTTWETIVEKTYINAIKNRGYKANVVDVNKNITEASTAGLVLIFSEIYGIEENEMRVIIYKAQKCIKYIKANTNSLGHRVEYRIFKKILEYQIKELQKEERLII